MNTLFVLIAGLLGSALVWTALVGYTLGARILHDRRMRRIEDALVGEGSRELTAGARIRRVHHVLARTAAGTLRRLVVDKTQPEILRREVAAILLTRSGTAALTRDAAHGRWFSRRWRRVVAWQVLHLTRSAELHPLLRDALSESDQVLRATVVTMLGAIRDRPAAAILVEALRRESCAPASIAMQLDRFAAAPKEEALLPLLEDPQAVLRFWAIRLLARDRRLGRLDVRLGVHARDPDPRVRKAVAEAMGEVGGPCATAVLIDLLSDDTGFVRAQAVRSFGKLAGPASGLPLEELLAPLIADSDWWVRLGVREALAKRRGTGIPVRAGQPRQPSASGLRATVAVAGLSRASSVANRPG